jgi:uncharacterized protein YndB with AHSA1/START domain
LADVVVTRVIAASPATVFSFFTDAERWTQWQGVGGEIDARPGGVFLIRMPRAGSSRLSRSGGSSSPGAGRATRHR